MSQQAPTPDVASVDAARQLVQMIDGAIKGNVDATTVANTWMRGGHKPLVLRDGGVEVDKIDCGAAGDGLGDWPKLLSDAGVRSLAPRRDLSGASLQALATALGDGTAASIHALRQWIWSGGPFGIQFQLGAPMWQAPARLGYDCPPRAELDALRAKAAARNCPKTTQPWPAGNQLLTLTLRQANASAQRRAVNDAGPWIEACLAAYAPLPTERTSEEEQPKDDADAPQTDTTPPPPPEHFAGVIRSQLPFGASLALEELWGGLNGRDLGVATELKQALPAREVGRIVGQTQPLDAEKVQQIAGLIESGSDFAAGVASGLLLRAVDARTVDGVCALLQRLGLQRVWLLADLDGITAKSAKGLALVLKKVDAGPTLWADLVGAAPPAIAAWILRGSPPHILSRVGGQLRAKFVSQPPEETAPLVRVLITMGEVVPLRAVGEALRETRGAGWSGQLVPAVCQALLAHGMGEELLVPLFLDREADTKLRLLVLRSLDGHAELLTEATRFRFGELVEPKQIQVRLKAARKKLKGQR